MQQLRSHKGTLPVILLSCSRCRFAFFLPSTNVYFHQFPQLIYASVVVRLAAFFTCCRMDFCGISIRKISQVESLCETQTKLTIKPLSPVRSSAPQSSAGQWAELASYTADGCLWATVSAPRYLMIHWILHCLLVGVLEQLWVLQKVQDTPKGTTRWCTASLVVALLGHWLHPTDATPLTGALPIMADNQPEIIPTDLENSLMHRRVAHQTHP